MQRDAMRRFVLGGAVALLLVTGTAVAPTAGVARAQAGDGEIDPCADDPGFCWCFFSGQCPEEDIWFDTSQDQ
jgi:hypothetical protein